MSFLGRPSFSAETRARFNFRRNERYSASLRGTPIRERMVTWGARFPPRALNRSSIAFAMTRISASSGGKKFVCEVFFRYGTFPFCVYWTPAQQKWEINVFRFSTASSARSQPCASFTSARCSS